MIELSRAQDEEVGDGTTSVIILTGEVLHLSEDFLTRNMHPTVIVAAYNKALQFALETCKSIAKPVDLQDRAAMTELIQVCRTFLPRPRV